MSFKKKVLLGTCGWSYDDWEASFYESGLPKRDRLEVYARHFGTVEIDSTFYAIPPMKTVQSWHARTPKGFIFSAKFPRLITHEHRLENAGALAQSFVETMSELGEKLGALLIQLPPTIKVSAFDTLARFLEGLPDGYIYALEVRDRSWLTEDLARLLKRWKIVLVLSDGEHMERFWRVTSRVVYIRWLGRQDAFDRYDRLQREVDEDLRYWIPRMEHFLGRGGTILGYVNNKYAGHSPAVVDALKQGIGREYLRRDFLVSAPQVTGRLPGINDEPRDGDDAW